MVHAIMVVGAFLLLGGAYGMLEVATLFPSAKQNADAARYAAYRKGTGTFDTDEERRNAQYSWLGVVSRDYCLAAMVGGFVMLALCVIYLSSTR